MTGGLAVRLLVQSALTANESRLAAREQAFSAPDGRQNSLTTTNI